MKYKWTCVVRAVRYMLLVFFVWTTVSTSHAQENLEFVAHLSEEPSFAVAVRDTILYSSPDSSVAVFSISDPSKPRKLATVPLRTKPNELVLRGGHLYVAGCHVILTILDVSNPALPWVMNDITDDWGAACVSHLAFRGDTAFVPIRAGLTSSHMWDISNPLELNQLDKFTTVTKDVAFTDRAFYSIASNPWYARVASWRPFDIEGQSYFPEARATWAGELERDHLYVVGAQGLYVYDIQPDSLPPTRVAHVEELGELLDLALANDRLYLAGGENGLVVADVSDPAQPEIIARFDVPNAVDVVVSDSLVFLSAGDDGLYILRDVTATGVEREPPRELAQLFLEPVAPNPVRENATIRFRLPNAGTVRVAVYDALGREVAVIVDAYRPRGRHEVTWTPMELASGMYVLHLEAGTYRESRSFSLVR